MYETNIIPRESEFYGYIEKINEPVVGTNGAMKIKITKMYDPASQKENEHTSTILSTIPLNEAEFVFTSEDGKTKETEERAENEYKRNWESGKQR